MDICNSAVSASPPFPLFSFLHRILPYPYNSDCSARSRQVPADLPSRVFSQFFLQERSPTKHRYRPGLQSTWDLQSLEGCSVAGVQVGSVHSPRQGEENQGKVGSRVVGFRTILVLSCTVTSVSLQAYSVLHTLFYSSILRTVQADAAVHPQQKQKQKQKRPGSKPKQSISGGSRDC
jgi:hypothetical protein